MPPLTRRFLRTGLVFLVVGVLTGLHMASALHFGAGVMHGYYLSAHAHVLLVGFLLSTLAGLALWKLPGSGTRRSDALANLAYHAMTLGTALRFLFEVVLGYAERDALRVAVVLASTVQALGILAACAAIWPRLRA